MTSESKQIKQSAKSLHRMQAEQAKSVRQVGRLRAKLQKRSAQTQSREAKMAHLEQRLHALRNPGGQSMAQYAKGLRPARLIVDPNSGSFADKIGSVDKLVGWLRAHGILAEVFLKTSSRAVRRWTREAVDNDEALVIATGGDGTIEDVALSLVGSRTTLGIIPAGTMNNLARALGIPLDIEQACALLGAGSIRQIDVGVMRGPAQGKGTYFMETAGLGMSVALPAGQNIHKRRWRKLPANFRELFDVNATPTEIVLDKREKIETRVKLVTVSNAPLFAMNNLIAPDAKMDDGLFDLAVYDGLNDVELAEYFLSNADGKRAYNPNVRFYRARHVHIRSTQPLPATSDKDEHPAHDELDLDVIPRAISAIVGLGFGLSWPVEVVHSVPPLTGEQAPSKTMVAAEQGTLRAANGAEHGVAVGAPSAPPESSMVAAR